MKDTRLSRKKLRIKLARLSILFVLSIFLGFVSTAVLAKSKTLKVAHFLRDVHPMCQGLKWWGDEVTRRTYGEIKFKYYWANSIASAPELYDAIRLGLADLGPIVPVFSITKTPIYTIGTLPAMPSTRFLNAVWAAHQLGKTEAAQAEFKANKLHFLYGNGHSGDFIYSAKPIRRFEDFKGMKISSFGSLGEACRIWGADISWLGVSETYEGLKNGIVEGANKPLVSGISEGLYEVAPNVMLTPQLGINVSAVVVMNGKTWMGLSAKTQKVINEVSDEMPWKLAELFDKSDPTYIKQMKAKGVTFTNLPEADVVKMQEMVKPVWNKWADDMNKKGLPGTELKKQFYDWVAEGPPAR